jgi:hypothetical protein
MGELVELGKIQREIIQSSEKEPIVIRTVSFLRTYGLKMIDTSIIRKAIFRGGIKTEDLAVFYLNWMLERRLGKGFVLKGNPRETYDKFFGMHLFHNEGKGPLRWAVKKVNQGKFISLEQAWRKIYREDEPGGGLFVVKDQAGNRFVFDPLYQNFRKGKFKVGRCWAYRNGKEFFIINDGKENFFVSDRGQSPSEALWSLEQ